jgi:hypothetical protein
MNARFASGEKGPRSSGVAGERPVVVSGLAENSTTDQRDGQGGETNFAPHTVSS